MTLKIFRGKFKEIFEKFIKIKIDRKKRNNLI